MTGLVAIGGDGSYRGAEELDNTGLPTVAIPGTIDNDISGTDLSIGFDTALNTVPRCHREDPRHRIESRAKFVIEVMGRTSGILATYAGLAAGGDCILVPEVEWCIEDVCETVAAGVRRGKKHSIIILAEGAGHAFGLAEDLQEHCGHDVRTVVLGHVQRGGSPSAFDRIIASRFAEKAVRTLLAGESGMAVGSAGLRCVRLPIAEAYVRQHPLRREIYQLARILAR